jgi:hypothetical protein
MRRISLAILLSCVLVPGSLAPRVAFAQDPNADLSPEQKLDKAKGLYGEAEKAFAAGDFVTAVQKYEEAYFLVPEKVGFAHKVGITAWKLGDCNKADEYLKHYVQYETNTEKNGDKIDESKKIIGEIAVSGCATPKPQPADGGGGAGGGGGGGGGGGTTEPNVGSDEPDLTSGRDERKQPDEGGGPKKKKGLLIGGAGVLGKAQSNVNKLEDLSSNATPTFFPEGDYGDDEPYNLDRQLDTLNPVGIACLAAGGVLIAGGAALIAVHAIKQKKANGNANLRRKSNTPRLTGLGVGPVPGGGAAAGASLRF